MECSNEFVCITLYGVRQVGKSTTLQMMFGNKFNKVSIDSCEKIFPINENVYYCPISLIGL